MDIPEVLLEEVERGNVLLFVGEGVVCDAEGRMLLDRLADALASRSGIIGAEPYTFPSAAQAYHDREGRTALNTFVCDQLEALGHEPQQVHRLIARLTKCNVLVTTCFDLRLEQAFKQMNRPYNVITGRYEIPFEEERKTPIYKVRGSIDRVDTLVLTEDDYAVYLDGQTSIAVILQGYLARKTILFLGYDLGDLHFQQLYHKAIAPLDTYARPSYLVGPSPKPNVNRWCTRRKVHVIEAQVEPFLASLIDQLVTRARPDLAMLQTLMETSFEPPPESPYKLLDYLEMSNPSVIL